MTTHMTLPTCSSPISKSSESEESGDSDRSPWIFPVHSNIQRIDKATTLFIINHQNDHSCLLYVFNILVVTDCNNFSLFIVFRNLSRIMGSADNDFSMAFRINKALPYWGVSGANSTASDNNPREESLRMTLSGPMEAMLSASTSKCLRMAATAVPYLRPRD